MNVEVNVRDRVPRTVSEVFAAIVDPVKMSRFFISSASGPMKPGVSVEWLFSDVGVTLSVDVIRIEENRTIIFDWAASGVRTRVTIGLKPSADDGTLVAVNEAAWPMNEEGVKRALDQTQGWTDFLCCMNAFLQHGINLRLGRTREDH